jgi:hypothetical protein
MVRKSKEIQKGLQISEFFLFFSEDLVTLKDIEIRIISYMHKQQFFFITDDSDRDIYYFHHRIDVKKHNY